MKRSCILFLFLSSFSSCGVQESPISKESEDSDENSEFVIAFGSCNKQDKEQPLWDDILDEKPDVWIWLGDNIYGDSEDVKVLESKYNLVKSNKQYAILQNAADVYGIWDDHDYGVNDGGKEFPIKKEARDLMFEFLNVPKEHNAWSHEGAYQSYTLEYAGISVKLILLDSRYFRDQPIKSGKQYTPNTEGTILGPEQWAWLENELSESKADVNLIGNGIQIIAEDHRFEKWANFPKERQKLFNLISTSGAQKVVLMSGDRHLSELSKINLQDSNEPLYDITSSGLTHSYNKYSGEENQHRVGEVVSKISYGVLKIQRAENEEIIVKLQFRGDKRIVFAEYILF